MFDSMTLKDWLQQEPFTLTLSAGFFGFYAHCGLLRALEENDIKPRRTTGSSAGALCAVLWASGTTSTELAQTLLNLKREDFWDPSPGLGLLRGQAFHALLANLLGAQNFEDAPLPSAVVAFNTRSFRTEILDTGSMALAIRASCAFPGLMQPVRIGPKVYLDGGIGDRMGLRPIRSGERVFYHHLATTPPWRRRRAKPFVLPKQENLTTLNIQNIPALGPFRLSVGEKAMERAYQGAIAALKQPVGDGTIHLLDI